MGQISGHKRIFMHFELEIISGDSILIIFTRSYLVQTTGRRGSIKLIKSPLAMWLAIEARLQSINKTITYNKNILSASSGIVAWGQGAIASLLNFGLSENCKIIFGLENICSKMQNLKLKTSMRKKLEAELKFGNSQLSLWKAQKRSLMEYWNICLTEFRKYVCALIFLMHYHTKLLR